MFLHSVITWLLIQAVKMRNSVIREGDVFHLLQYAI